MTTRTADCTYGGLYGPGTVLRAFHKQPVLFSSPSMMTLHKVKSLAQENTTDK
jgi:hypothetical protein